MNNTRILLLEDDADILYALKELLLDHHLAPTCTSTTANARVLLLTRDFDLFLSDILLSETDTGLDLVRSLAGSGRVPPVLFLTGLPHERVTELFDFGPDLVASLFPRGQSLLHKPFNTEQLFTAIRALLPT